MPRLHPHTCRIEHNTRANLCDARSQRFASLAIEQRDLMIRASELGPKYGMPLSRLEKTFSLHECHGPRIQRTWHPRIKHGSLMLWKTTTLDISLLYAFYPQIARLWWSACRHSDLFMEGVVNCALGHFTDPAPSAPEKGAKQTPPKCFRLIQCTYCATDIQVEIMRWWSSKRLTLRIHAWMDFGGRHTTLTSPQGAHFNPNDLYAIQHRSVWRAESDLREKFGRDCCPEWFIPAHHKPDTCILDKHVFRTHFLSASV